MTKNLSPKIIKSLISVARAASFAGANRSLKYFTKIPPVETKADRSPVTRADKEAESEIRKVLRKHFPQHLIVGEEHGVDGPTGSEFKWWIDPIDGTMQFIRGLPFWGSVLGVEYQGEVVAGVLLLPAIEVEVYAAKGRGCFMNRERCRVTKVKKLANATISPGGIFRGTASHQKRVLKLASNAYDVRGTWDVFSHVLVISGKMDAAVDFGINPYDVSAIKICVEEAGGLYTGISGKPSIYEKAGLSSNKLVHKECLSYFN